MTLEPLRMPFPATPGATEIRAAITVEGPKGPVLVWPHPGTTTVARGRGEDR